jgi:hypothetical protein
MVKEYNQINQPVMWKNVFLESCLLSALIFAGFYFNAAVLKDDLYSNDNKASSYVGHISGTGAPLELPKHISGKKLEKESHISGGITPTNTQN